LNIRTEQLENHAVRLTVEIDAAAFEEAKRQAVRTISGKLNIPGFRKGKAPVLVVTRYVGEAYILDETIETLGQKLYKQALEESKIEPAAPGAMEDFKPDPPTFIYTVPLAPTVTLSDYRAIRVDYTEPVVGDEEVDAELRSLQREFAETAVSEDAAALEDRITCDLHSFFVTEDAETDAEANVHDRKEEPYVHRHGAVINLLEGDDEPLAPGFSANVIGAKAGDVRTFRLTFPTGDPKINPNIAGRTIEFVVSVEQVEKVVLPEIDEALAAKISQRYNWDEAFDNIVNADDEIEELDDVDDEALEVTLEEIQAEIEAAKEQLEADSETAVEALDLPDVRPLSLEEVRVRLKEAVEKRTVTQNREGYANKVLEQVIDNAQVAFNEASVEVEIDSMVEDLKDRLRQNRLDLDTYLKQTGRGLEDIRGDYREPASKFLRRSLIIREFANAEQLGVSQEELQARFMEVLGELGADAINQLGIMRDERFVNNMANNLMSQKIEARAIAIGKGEAPILSGTKLVLEDSPVVDEAAADEAES